MPLNPPKPLTKEELAARGLETPPKYISDTPTLRIEVTTTDTGERSEMFGYTARHVVTTRKIIPLEGSPSRPQESVMDGWYIDSKLIASSEIDLRQQRLSCDRKWPEGKQGQAYLYAAGGNRPIDRPDFVTIGEPETGFAVRSVTTSKYTYTQGGTTKQSNSKFETYVTELEAGPLDPSLFEIPSGFKQVDHIERGPAVSAFSSQPKDFWQRVKTSLADLFNPLN